LVFTVVDSEEGDFYRFENVLLDEGLIYPDWFKTHFGDLNEKLKTAIETNKKGNYTHKSAGYAIILFTLNGWV